MSLTSSHEFFIQLHLTERCNLRCSHCYQTGKKTDEMSFNEIRDLAEETSDMLDLWSEHYNISFIPSMNITGGEPFLRQDIFEILDEIGRRGFDLHLLSNGILINKERAKLLAGCRVKGVQVSLEGPEVIHETIRGRGSFSSSLKGVQCLLDAGIPVTLNATLSTINADHMMDMVKLSSALGVHKLGFSRLVPSGRGAGLLKNMMGKEKVRELYEAIFSLDTKGLEIVTGDPVASQMRSECIEHNVFALPTGGCAAGVSGLTVLPDGTITPCRRMNIPLGNVRKDSLREVWSTSPVLESLRDKSRYRGKCSTCKRWTHCRGCRAIAYAYAQSRGSEDFLGEDPQCFIDG
jgi:radical SAM protein with 4Fe4S-binding SPASM domain